MQRYAMPLLLIPVFALMILIYTVSASAAAQGGFSQPAQGGYAGPGPDFATVQQAGKMRDDSHVSLRGNIIQHLGKDKYLFRDATGDITIEIDHDKWGGQNIGPEDAVEIYGEVDKDWNSVEIDVDRVVKK